MNYKTFITVGYLIFNILNANQALAEVCSRTPQVKVALENVINKPCAEIEASDLALVQNLNLQGQSIISLGSSDFFGLNNLQFLSLFNNKLTALPIGGFEGLNNLQNLDLTDNKLTSLPADVFKGLNNLLYLSLFSNQLTALPSGVFEGLNNLQTLTLYSNKLTALPSQVFEGLNNLQTLDLSSNQLTALPSQVFEGLNNLQTLCLNNNQLTALPSGVFEGLNNLQTLYLNNNQLTELPVGVFEGLDNLQTLVLYDNQLRLLQTGFFNGLISIRDIDLRSNQISSIEDNPFGVKFFCYPKISVNLSNNPIAVFPLDKRPKILNPYQCPVLTLTDNDPIVDQFFHLTLTRLDTKTPTFTQIEHVVPLLESSFVRDYSQMPITAHYGFDLIPTLDGTVGGLYIVRQLAVDVCALVQSFCPIRQEIHEYPRLSHLNATTDLKNELIALNAPHETIDKVAELEKSLLQMFSRDLNYQKIRTNLPEGPLKHDLDNFFSQVSWGFEDISKVVSRINSELTQAQGNAWINAYFVAFFKVKSFLIYTFKKNFWSISTQELLNVKTVQNLVEMSQGVALLSEKEARFLKLALERGDDLQKIIDKSIAWQLKNLEREHFSQVNNQAYTPVSADLPDPNIVLEPLFQKIVRTSLIAEWDRLK